MNVNDIFPSKFLKGSDFPAERTLTMRRISQEKMGSDVKPVLYFDELPKGLALNKTNGNAIAEVYGFDTDGWWGKRVAVYFDPSIDFQGRRVGGLRIKAGSNGHAPAPARQGGVWTTARAWAEYKKIHSELSEAEQKEGFRTACTDYFGPEFDHKNMRPDQWERFVADGFCPAVPEGANDDDSIPF